MEKNKRIGTITFHASYNHGSCLQAYALQEFTKDLMGEGCCYEIINLRTETQKNIYKTPFEKAGLKNLAKRLIYIGFKKRFQKRAQNYEAFIKEKLNTTKEFASIDELKAAKLKYDYYMSGSDQIWNLECFDFDWSNFLEFCNSGKKISYAASFGPLKNKWDKDNAERIKNDLSRYNSISVREEGSAEAVESLTGLKPTICVDPTLLISEDKWSSILGDKLIDRDYIFLYDVKNLKDASVIAKKVSGYYKMPVVIVKENIEKHLHGSFVKKYDAGPIEFLNYVKNAKIVLSSSFHGTVFATIFKKPFFAINGRKDLRINGLLSRMGLEDRCVDTQDIDAKLPGIFDVSFDKATKVIDAEREKSKKFLARALELGDKQ